MKQVLGVAGHKRRQSNRIRHARKRLIEEGPEDMERNIPVTLDPVEELSPTSTPPSNDNEEAASTSTPVTNTFLKSTDDEENSEAAVSTPFTNAFLQTVHGKKKDEIHSVKSLSSSSSSSEEDTSSDDSDDGGGKQTPRKYSKESLFDDEASEDSNYGGSDPPSMNQNGKLHLAHHMSTNQRNRQTKQPSSFQRAIQDHSRRITSQRSSFTNQAPPNQAPPNQGHAGTSVIPNQGHSRRSTSQRSSFTNQTPSNRNSINQVQAINGKNRQLAEQLQQQREEMARQEAILEQEANASTMQRDMNRHCAATEANLRERNYRLQCQRSNIANAERSQLLQQQMSKQLQIDVNNYEMKWGCKPFNNNKASWLGSEEYPIGAVTKLEDEDYDSENQVLVCQLLDVKSGRNDTKDFKPLSFLDRARRNQTSTTYGRLFLFRDVPDGNLFYVMEDKAKKRNINFWDSMVNEREKSISVGSYFGIREPDTISHWIRSIPLVDSDSSAVLFSSPPCPKEVTINNQIEPNRSKFFSVNGCSTKVVKPTAYDSKCTGTFCDRQNLFSPGTQCGCYTTHDRTAKVTLLYQKVKITTPLDESFTMEKFSSLRFNNLFLSGEFASGTTRMDVENVIRAIRKDHIQKIVDEINNGCGWTVQGWYRRGEVSDTTISTEKESSKIASGDIKYHITSLVPTNAVEINPSQKYNVRNIF